MILTHPGRPPSPTSRHHRNPARRPETGVKRAARVRTRSIVKDSPRLGAGNASERVAEHAIGCILAQQYGRVRCTRADAERGKHPRYAASVLHAVAQVPRRAALPCPGNGEQPAAPGEKPQARCHFATRCDPFEFSVGCSCSSRANQCSGRPLGINLANSGSKRLIPFLAQQAGQSWSAYL